MIVSTEKPHSQCHLPRPPRIHPRFLLIFLLLFILSLTFHSPPTWGEDFFSNQQKNVYQGTKKIGSFNVQKSHFSHNQQRNRRWLLTMNLETQLFFYQQKIQIQQMGVTNQSFRPLQFSATTWRGDHYEQKNCHFGEMSVEISIDKSGIILRKELKLPPSFHLSMTLDDYLAVQGIEVGYKETVVIFDPETVDWDTVEIQITEKKKTDSGQTLYKVIKKSSKFANLLTEEWLDKNGHLHKLEMTNLGLLILDQEKSPQTKSQNNHKAVGEVELDLLFPAEKIVERIEFSAIPDRFPLFSEVQVANIIPNQLVIYPQVPLDFLPKQLPLKKNLILPSSTIQKLPQKDKSKISQLIRFAKNVITYNPLAGEKQTISELLTQKSGDLLDQGRLIMLMAHQKNIPCCLLTGYVCTPHSKVKPMIWCAFYFEDKWQEWNIETGELAQWPFRILLKFTNSDDQSHQLRNLWLHHSLPHRIFCEAVQFKNLSVTKPESIKPSFLPEWSHHPKIAIPDDWQPERPDIQTHLPMLGLYRKESNEIRIYAKTRTTDENLDFLINCALADLQLLHQEGFINKEEFKKNNFHSWFRTERKFPSPTSMNVLFIIYQSHGYTILLTETHSIHSDTPWTIDNLLEEK